MRWPVRNCFLPSLVTAISGGPANPWQFHAIQQGFVLLSPGGRTSLTSEEQNCNLATKLSCGQGCCFLCDLNPQVTSESIYLPRSSLLFGCTESWNESLCRGRCYCRPCHGWDALPRARPCLFDESPLTWWHQDKVNVRKRPAASFLPVLWSEFSGRQSERNPHLRGHSHFL